MYERQQHDSPSQWNPIVRYAQAAPKTGAGDALAGREVILASAPQALAVGEDATVTLRANESGHIDLKRVQLFISSRERASSTPLRRVEERTRITSILVWNSHQKLRGLTHVAAPAGVFSSLRRAEHLHFETIHLAATDTLAISIRVDEYPPDQQRHVSVAVPFRPDVSRSDAGAAALPDGPETYLATPTVTTATTMPFQLTFTPEEDGVVDLASLQISGTATTSDPLSHALLESIRLPSGEDLIVGSTSPYTFNQPIAAPASMFSDRGRKKSWVELGFVPLCKGQQISLQLRTTYADDLAPAIFGAGLRFFSTLKISRSRSSAKVSDFFDHEPAKDID